MLAAYFRDIVSGRRHGVTAGLIRSALAAVECCYSTAVRRRNRHFDNCPDAVLCVGVPVISVGNLTLGGTGKTPMVRWIAGWLAKRGVRVAIISRGYGSTGNRPNDESLELATALPDVPQLQNPDRYTAAREAIHRFGCQAIVLDDGFQHRRLGRDLDIVLLDALEPFGFGRLFPRGMLREPVESLARADVVALSRADCLPSADREAIWQTVRRVAPQADCIELSHTPQRLVNVAGEQLELDSLRGCRVAAFCGIGNPAGFQRTLEACGCQVVGFRALPDHHRFTPADMAALAVWAATLKPSAVLCTCKDLVKLSIQRLADCPLWAVKIEIGFLSGRESVESRLEVLCSHTNG